MGRIRTALATAPVLPVRPWFNRWFRAVSDHVSEAAADTQQVVKQSRDDLVHEVRASEDGIGDRLQGRLDRVIADIRAEAAGVAEVALATERRLARLESIIAFVVSEDDATATAIVDGPWVHRALAASPPSTVVLPGRCGRLAEELRAAGHIVVVAAADRSADLVIVRDVAPEDLEGVVEAGRRALATGGRLILAVDGTVPDKLLDGWAVLDERVVARTTDGWRSDERSTAATRSLYVLG